MSFNPNVPNASQSPGIFPAQNNTNFNRLKTIINADHVFNDSAQTTDGIHRQCTMVSRAVPMVLPAGSNAILYSWVDGLGQTQLRFYNGNTDEIITKEIDESPIRIVGSQVIGANSDFICFANPGYAWAGTGWAVISNTNRFSFYNMLRSGGNDIHEQDQNGSSRPTLTFNGSNDVVIANTQNTTNTCVWSLIINRIS